MRRSRSRRNGRFGKFKPLLTGAAWGAGAAAVLVLIAAAAQGRLADVPAALPRNLFTGAIAGLVMTKFFHATPVTAALTAGTGIYLANSVRAAIPGGAA